AVVGDVQFAAHEPLGERWVTPVLDVVPALRPGEPLRLLRPEAQTVLRCPLVDVCLDVGRCGELCGRGEAPCLLQKVRKCLLALAQRALLAREAGSPGKPHFSRKVLVPTRVATVCA